ncbi:Uu.00g124300.m01.CDS01 [Anthostomella pinea]|uniref:Uu.00g124300.m01.CDS01 n=1 Tax=Anthostomella pinea TaxID=933095 RepID=A0AAI8VI86_9PEZI|nr:Uu.00g124300.m01.CDS01 [Anthostomella pinea]
MAISFGYGVLAAFFAITAVFASPVALPDVNTSSTQAHTQRDFMINKNTQYSSLGYTWPNNKVTWCLNADKEADYKTVRDIADKSWKKWKDVIGEKSSLKFAPVDDKELECKKYRGKVDMWEITLNYKMHAGSAHSGYMYQDNRLNFDPRPIYSAMDAVVNFAHEMGHAFGLLHTHQRPDAWPSLLKLNCRNLRDYDSLAKKIGKGKVDDICKTLNRRSAAAEGFSAAELLPYSNYMKDTSKEIVQNGDFDWDSIMLYNSEAGAKDGTLALVKENGSKIGINTEVSKGDGKQIENLYPKGK